MVIHYDKAEKSQLSLSILPLCNGIRWDMPAVLLGYYPNGLAKMLIKFNNHSTNAFIQQIRHRLSMID